MLLIRWLFCLEGKNGDGTSMLYVQVLQDFQTPLAISFVMRGSLFWKTYEVFLFGKFCLGLLLKLYPYRYSSSLSSVSMSMHTSRILHSSLLWSMTYGLLLALPSPRRAHHRRNCSHSYFASHSRTLHFGARYRVLWGECNLLNVRKVGSQLMDGLESTRESIA